MTTASDYTHSRPPGLFVTGFVWRTALFLCALILLSGCASTVKNTARTFNTVVIDAGHGAHDSGARRNGLTEKTLCLDVAARLEQHLRAAGFRTVMTRRDDTFIPLNTRVDISNKQHNAIFVSIHFNDGRRRARGVEVYYRSPESFPLAKSVYGQLTSVAAGHGIRTAHYRVLKCNQFPAILVECGFLSNRSEAAKIRKSEYRHALAERIANGLIAARHPRGGPKAGPAADKSAGAR